MKFLRKRSYALLLVLTIITGCTITVEDSRKSIDSSIESSKNSSVESSLESSKDSSIISSIDSSEVSSIPNSSSESSSSTYSNSSVEYMPYYTGVEGLTGEALKKALHDIIDDHVKYSYDDIWDILKESDEDPNNPDNVILLYSGISRSKDRNGGQVGDWNREHVWPKSKGNFGTKKGAGTDAHHLRPTDVQVNSTRGNKDFGNVVGGTKVKNTTDCYYKGNVFEPRDEVKGDVARMVFYMAVRYEGDVSGEPNLELNELLTNTSNAPYLGKLSTLLEWHLQDLPDEFEMRRNEVVYSYQGNRNPFIDYPDFALMIWG